MASSVRGSFGALPFRPTAVIRRTSHEVLLCVAMVLINRAFPQRVTRSERPLYQRLQHRFAFNEDGRSDRASLQGLHVLIRASVLVKGYRVYVVSFETFCPLEFLVSRYLALTYSSFPYERIWWKSLVLAGRNFIGI